MKNLLFLTALILLTVAYANVVEDQYDASFQQKDTFCYSELNKAWADLISEKFYRDHICEWKVEPEQIDGSAFCNTFRPDFKGTVYEVMLLKQPEIKKLHEDLERRQKSFMDNEALFNDSSFKKPSGIHYFTEKTYTFMYCEKKDKEWGGKLENNRYQLYVPRGPIPVKESQVYQIYHGCGSGMPLESLPSDFSVLKPCKKDEEKAKKAKEDEEKAKKAKEKEKNVKEMPKKKKKKPKKKKKMPKKIIEDAEMKV